MHELRIIREVFDDLIKLAKENQTEKVTKVYLRMGEFIEINEDIVRHFFNEKGKDTLAQDAELSIEKSPNRELTLVSFDCK